jgi:hypothetical protein
MRMTAIDKRIALQAKAALRRYVSAKRERDGIAWEVERGSLHLSPKWWWRATLVAPRGRRVRIYYTGSWRTS